MMTLQRKLADLVKLPLLERAGSMREIATIWHDFHADKPSCVSMQMDAWRMDKLLRNAATSPMFVTPVQRPEGKFVSLVSQFQHNTCLVTPLDAYQMKAQPFLVFALYNELCETKQVGLVRGDITVSTSIISKDEAARVMKHLVHFYTSADYNVVRQFNHDPRRFDMNTYIRDQRV